MNANGKFPVRCFVPCILLFVACHATLAQVSFRPLGFLSSDGYHYSLGGVVSADGGTIVGYSNDIAVFWRSDGTIHPFGPLPLPFNDFTAASAVSADGRFVAAGGCWESSDEIVCCAARGTTEPATLTLLLPLPTDMGNTSDASGISDDGRII